MTSNKNGFSLVEVMVALSVISVGIIGTLSMVSANRAIMASTWDMARMGLIADSVMNELAVRAQRGDTLPAAGTYDWSSDTNGLAILFSDNGYSAAASTLAVASSTAPNAVMDVTLTVKSPAGRTLVRERSFFETFQTP
jgi:prepilin-type N-terminal cleavage/methylation domain-containing protein